MFSLRAWLFYFHHYTSTDCDNVLMLSSSGALTVIVFLCSLTLGHACIFFFFLHISVINSSVHSTCYQVEQCTMIYVNTYSQKHLHVCANGTYAVSYGYNKLSVTYNGMVAACLLELIARRYNRMVSQVFNGLWTMDIIVFSLHDCLCLLTYDLLSS